jgi:cysteine sulfinate desulfinase/cysteine desulfurase-like protein
VLVTIMHANNEVGTIEPVREIADIAHRHGILMHSDCAQSIGKIPVTVDQLGVDLLSMAGHKLYAPKGIGVLYRRQGVELEKLIHGANHEMNWRAGTENVVEIVGLGEACELIRRNLTTYQEHLGQMRDRLEEGLRTHFPDLRINGRPQQRLPNTSSVSFPGVAASTLLGQMPGVAASAGAACHSDRVEVSSVLEAMGLPLELAMGTVRLSVGRYTTAAEIDRAVAEIARGVADYRSQSHTTSKVGD